MPGKRPKEPVAPTTIPGEPLDPKIPPDQWPEPEEDEESDEGAKVTPLDKDKKIKEGIEINET